MQVLHISEVAGLTWLPAAGQTCVIWLMIFMHIILYI